jgi:TPR repeat protein
LASVLICGSCSGGDDQDGFDSGTRALSEGNYAEAYCRWKPLAQAGHADAQYHLGWLYANGNGLAVDIDRALEWWGAAARQGHADAQFAVGLAHTTGEGIGKDLREAVVWYLSAARQGHQDARDILIRLNGDPAVQLLDWHPEIANEDWFGWELRLASA